MEDVYFGDGCGGGNASLSPELFLWAFKELLNGSFMVRGRSKKIVLGFNSLSSCRLNAHMDILQSNFAIVGKFVINFENGALIINNSSQGTLVRGMT